MVYISISILILIILSIIGILVKNTYDNKEKLRIYECGYSEITSPKEKYYIKYYIIGILYLIFDIETILIYPMAINISSLKIIYYYMLLLSIGLAIEIYNKFNE